MNRKEFILRCGALCAGSIGINILLQNCTTGHYAQSEIDGSHLKVALSEFTKDAKGNSIDRKYLVVKSDKLQFPIYLYKNSTTDYKALWMECSHLGAELYANGEYLTCPAHGSEFNHEGNVVQGPAARPLRTFKTSVKDEFIFIQLS